MLALDTIYCMDALEFLKQLDSDSIGLIITSPPYNLRNSTGGFWKSTDESSNWGHAALRSGYDCHSDDMPHNDYVAWQKNCLTEMYRILKPDGAIFYNHKPRVQAGLLESPNDIVSGFPVRQIIVWDRGSGINFNKGYFLPSYEYIYIICKPDFKLNENAYAYRDIWRINFQEDNEHPAPFPIELPRRIISCVDTDLVIDPFMGSGTTAIAAKLASKHYIGCDLSQYYVDLAINRLQNSDPYQATILSNGSKQLSLFEDKKGE